MQIGLIGLGRMGANMSQRWLATGHTVVGYAPRPLRETELYRYHLDLPAVTEVWRRGSVVAGWLLDLTAQAFAHSADVASFAGRVSDLGKAAG